MSLTSCVRHVVLLMLSTSLLSASLDSGASLLALLDHEQLQEMIPVRGGDRENPREAGCL